MAVDPTQIQLSSDQQAALADLADATGKPWPVVLSEALTHYKEEGAQKKNGDVGAESFLSAASRLGLVGSLQGGPPDLSTSPCYMEGFGRDNG